MLSLLAEVKLEDVFQSTNQSMNEGPGSTRLLMLLAGAAGLVLLLVFLQYRRKNQAIATPVNSQGKLTRDVARELQLKSAEVKQLRQLADGQSVTNPLVLLLCPSLLAKAAQGRSSQEKKLLAGLVKRLSADGKKDSGL